MPDEKERTLFWEHAAELRRTVIAIFAVILSGVILAFLFYKPLFSFLTYPLRNIAGEMESRLIILGPAEGIMAVFKICFWAAIVGTSPIWIYLMLLFLAPALKSRERKIIFPFLFFTLFFLASGFLFAFYITIPVANSYLNAFNEGIGVNFWTLSNYLDYTLILLLANALAFEIVVILLFLIHLEVVAARDLTMRRKPAIVVIFILSAFITPPDILSQALLAVPLIVLYEAAIFYAKTREIARGLKSDRVERDRR